MPKKKEIDNKALLKMIKDETNQAEIMEKFGFNNVTQLKVAYANALMDAGEAPEIKGQGRTKKAKPVDTKVSVNSRGSLIIPKNLIDSMEIKPGDIFEAKKTPSGIMLRTLEDAQGDTPTEKPTEDPATTPEDKLKDKTEKKAKK